MVFTYEPESLLEQRFKKTSEKSRSFFENVFTNLSELVKPLSAKNASSPEYLAKSRKLLLQAGYASSTDDVIKFDTKRLSNTIVVSVLMVILVAIDRSVNTVSIAAIVLYLVYKWPEMKLKKEIQFRQKEFERYLPDAVDLLAICVQAGLGLESAFQKVSEEFKLTSEIVSCEFGRLNSDILSGLNREEAYKNLILRNEGQDLQSFVALLIQSDRLGTSISQSLAVFCDTMRTRKRQRIEELSQKASTKMTIPMVLFLLPALFIIIMYPAIQKIMTNLGN